MSSRPSSFSLTSPGPKRMRYTAEMYRLPPPVWLIEGVMPMGGVVGLYGPPGTYKTFLAMDMALSVAYGIPWQGHDTKQGFVVYIAAEGGTGITIRIAAWITEHEFDENNRNIGWLTEPVPIHSESEDLEQVITRIADEIQRNPVLIVIDTLARSFDGNENEQEDMGRFIGGVDRLRKEFGATVLIVHHTRLDGQRERGNTAFRGAADTMLAVGAGEKHGDIRLTCSKQKDAADFGELTFKAKIVPVRLPGFTEFTSSIVIAQEHGDRDARILAAIRAAGSEGLTVRALATKFKPATIPVMKGARGKAHSDGLSISAATIKRRIVSLVENGKIIRKNGVCYYKQAHSTKASEPT